MQVTFTSSSIRCTICFGVIGGELQYTGDSYCKGHTNEKLNKNGINLETGKNDE